MPSPISPHSGARSARSAANWPFVLTIVLLPLVTAAAAVGIWVPGVYREPAAILPAMQGQDFVTLLAVPVLVLALIGHRSGSARGTLMWIGLLGYVLYTYTGAAIAYYVNRFTLLYIAVFSAAGFALIGALLGLDAAALQRRFEERAPRRSVAVFLLVIALMLGALEIGHNVAYLRSGELPVPVKLAGGGHYFVYALDLGVVVPLCLLAAWWLWQCRPRGEVLAGYLLIKATTMGLALLAMNGFSYRAGHAVDPPELLAFYALLAAGGLVMSCSFLRRCG